MIAKSLFPQSLPAALPGLSGHSQKCLNTPTLHLYDLCGQALEQEREIALLRKSNHQLRTPVVMPLHAPRISQPLCPLLICADRLQSSSARLHCCASPV